MTDLDLVIRTPRLISAAGEVGRIVGVKDGTIVAIEPLSSDLTAPRVVELPDDETLLPGVVDSHVHVNDPGRTDWEGFASATKAAAAGGVTTLIDMPLNSIPPTVEVAALEVKRKTAESQAHIDVGFWGGAIPGNVADLRSLYDAGVFGFKCFLLHSGVDEFPPLDPDQLEAAMREIASFDGLMIVHAEDTHAIEHAPTAHGETYTNFLSSRPRGAENLAIAQVIELARWTGCRVHILHVSSSDALPMIATARRELSLKAKRPVTRAVASVPLGHGPAARAAMLQAVETAGLELLRLVETPVAAALALELEARGDHDYLWLARGVTGFEAGVIAVDGGSVRLADYDLADRIEGLSDFVGRQAQVVGLLLDHVTAAEAASLSAKPVLPGFEADRSVVIGAALMAEALAG